MRAKDGCFNLFLFLRLAFPLFQNKVNEFNLPSPAKRYKQKKMFIAVKQKGEKTLWDEQSLALKLLYKSFS